MAFVPYYILIIIAVICIDYLMGLLIEQSKSSKRKFFLIVSLTTNIGILFFFKYYNFFIENINALGTNLGGHFGFNILNIILPIGLSFHTFQAMSYTIEVYRGNQKAEKHFGIYALYVLFYPQLVAGPIERPQNLLSQFRQEHHFDYNQVVSGLKLMLWGLFKKVVIADRLALVVGQVYAHPQEYQGLSLLIATYFFAFQIYCDFSGYTDIAIGAARVMGIKLMKNFNLPYFAQSIPQFWKRWHISLSTWFRDYLYLPLGGSRVSTSRWAFNIMLVFFISGFWHGANWTYIIWGALHGSYFLASYLTRNLRNKVTRPLQSYPQLKKAISIFITFHLVTFAWIFFRANSLHDAIYISNHLFTNLNLLPTLIRELAGSSGTFILSLGIDRMNLIIAFATIIFLLIAELAYKHFRFQIAKKPLWARWLVYYALVFAILSFGQFGAQQFIYFQF